MACVTQIAISDSDLNKMYDSTEPITRHRSGPAHTHPLSEYVKVLDGRIVLTYLEGNQIKTLDSTVGAFIAEEIPHQVFVDGSVMVYTSKMNVANVEKRDRIEDFISV